MNLFWQQQQKLFASNSTGVRYHPMIIRYCLSLVAKSPSLYEEIVVSLCSPAKERYGITETTSDPKEDSRKVLLKS